MNASFAVARRLRNRSTLIHVLTDAGLVLGGALALASFVAIAQDNSGLGFDTPSYWLAGRHVLEGRRAVRPRSLFDAGPVHVPADLRPAVRAPGARA